MKQLFITVAAVAFGMASANAQRINFTEGLQKKNKMEMAPVLQKSMQAPVKKQTNEELVIYRTDKLVPFKAPFRAEGEEEITLDAWYEIPEGAFFLGMDSEWRTYGVPIVQTPAWLDQKFINTTYYNDSTTEVTYKWTVEASEEIEMDQDEDNNGITSGWGYYDSPKLTATQGKLTSEHQLQSYAQEETVTGYWFAGTDSIRTLSHATDQMGFWGGFSDVEEMFAANTMFQGQKVTGFAEFFEACTDTVYATSLHLIGWLDDTDNKTTPLGDNELKAEIFLLNEDGSLSEEPYAVAYATNDEVNVLYEEYGSTTINFPFVEEDPLFGTVESAVILPKQKFVIIFSGFENMEGTFTIPFSSAYDGGSFLVAGHSYVLLEDGTFATIGYRSYPNVPQINLHIGVEAAIPVARAYFDDTVVEFPAEAEDGEDYVWGVTGYDPDDNEPYYDIDILTGTQYDEEAGAWQLDCPDWIKGFDFDNSLYEKYNIVVFYLLAEPLPEGVEGRSGEAIFSVYGKEVRIPVKQGKVEEALKGDVNGDGSVNVADISAVIDVMAGNANYDAADVNGDGTVNVADISNIIDIMAGN